MLSWASSVACLTVFLTRPEALLTALPFLVRCLCFIVSRAACCATRSNSSSSRSRFPQLEGSAPFPLGLEGPSPHEAGDMGANCLRATFWYCCSICSFCVAVSCSSAAATGSAARALLRGSGESSPDVSPGLSALARLVSSRESRLQFCLV